MLSTGLVVVKRRLAGLSQVATGLDGSHCTSCDSTSQVCCGSLPKEAGSPYLARVAIAGIQGRQTKRERLWHLHDSLSFIVLAFDLLSKGDVRLAFIAHDGNSISVGYRSRLDVLKSGEACRELSCPSVVAPDHPPILAGLSGPISPAERCKRCDLIG